MKGVVLAAGKGSRLYPVTHHVPKPLLPLANRPTLEYAFDRLKEMGVRDVCVVVGEAEAQMKAALGDGSAFGIRLDYVRQSEPQGLAHAVGFTRDFVDGDDFVLYLGDAIYGSGFEAYAARFRDSGCANLNIVKPVPDPSRFGVANVEGERIVKLVEKPKEPESNLAMAGLYFFGPQIWDVLPDLQPSARGEYEITDAIQMLVDRGESVLAGVYKGTWFDTGTLPSFLETSRFLTDGLDLVGAGAEVVGKTERCVIGEGAKVTCRSMADVVVLPGSKVDADGDLRQMLIGGEALFDGDAEWEIVWGLDRVAGRA
ncbi:MAG TPA: sugar phosphate nucleotidyltransferase [Fimbriimonadaceae bacterium]|nr:sugar phosphate nucleotidyltransferase [Fimbriimonadaceae bacterium]HRJ96188.1 sugar phosphate nucleotidyltransferase [Fimbriimonadaceae bacterium]